MDIDAVVLWVDGNDPEWIKEKEKYDPKEKTKDDVNRYRDWNLMKYWFRGIEYFAPFIRTVHFVTWGHVPDFLDTDNPKLNIVNHKDYMPEGSLPTYNSMALELNLHRIDGLAERFVYFNDDMFLTRKITPSDLFDDKTGKPRMYYYELPIRFKSYDLDYHIAKAVSMNLINRNVDKKSVKTHVLSRQYSLLANIRSIVMKYLVPEYYVGFRASHNMTPMLKKTFEDVWGLEPEVLKETSLHKFRAITDPNQLLIAWYQLATGNFVHKNNAKDQMYFDINESSIDDICNAIKNQRYEAICINDSDVNIDFESTKKRIADAFEFILPKRSSFEKKSDAEKGAENE